MSPHQCLHPNSRVQTTPTQLPRSDRHVPTATSQWPRSIRVSPPCVTPMALLPCGDTFCWGGAGCCHVALCEEEEGPASSLCLWLGTSWPQGPGVLRDGAMGCTSSRGQATSCKSPPRPAGFAPQDRPHTAPLPCHSYSKEQRLLPLGTLPSGMLSDNTTQRHLFTCLQFIGNERTRGKGVLVESNNAFKFT